MKAFEDTMATKTPLLSSWVYRVLRPIIRMLRSAGVSQAQMIECIRQAAEEHSGDTVCGRLGSDTRRDAIAALLEVTTAWARSSQWTDSTGRPRELSLRADDPKGFATLVREAEPKLSPAAALEQLRSLEVVRLVRNDESVRLLTPVIIHRALDTNLETLRGFAETLEYNLFRPRNAAARMQLVASRLSLDPARFEDFARFIRRSGESFLESADEALGAYVTNQRDRGTQFGVGVFVFCDGPSDEAASCRGGV
jgi:hypothetical protein